MGILSVAAAVHEAYAYKKADKELIKQYRYMQRIFGCGAPALNNSKGAGEQQQILRTLGEAALTEHASGPSCTANVRWSIRGSDHPFG
jgi:hypothetical protein